VGGRVKRRGGEKKGGGGKFWLEHWGKRGERMFPMSVYRPKRTKENMGREGEGESSE